MPQHWVGRNRVTPSRVLVAVLALALVGAYVQLNSFAPNRPPAAGSNASAEHAARAALDRLEHGGAAPLVDVVGGSAGWQAGTLAIPAGEPGAREDEPRVYLFLAERRQGGWQAALEGTPEFEAMVARARPAFAGTAAGDLLATTVATSSGNGSAQLSLPWARGKTWRITGGPHHFRGGRSRPWSSLDFAGPRPGMSVKVRAARGGVVVRPCANLVQVRHGDGWTTSYYHLKDIQVRAGQKVSRGQFIGRISTRAGCGGSASGSHVHFSLLKSGSYVNIRGHAIGGWVVKEGAKPYEGCIVKDGVRRCAPGGRVYNNGDVGTDSTNGQTSMSGADGSGS